MEVRRNIKIEMARADKSVPDALHALNISSTTWYRKMKEPHRWTIGELGALAEFLGIPRDDLTAGGPR